MEHRTGIRAQLRPETGPPNHSDSSESMPFVGIPTFCKLPLHPRAGGRKEAGPHDFLILGVPFDEGTSNRPGARFGPRALRSASTLYAYEDPPELFDVELGHTILAGARTADYGDVLIEPLAGESNRRAIQSAVTDIADEGAIPICLGGDHSITASALEGLAGPLSGERPYLLHMDAHMDFNSRPCRHTHGSPVRTALERELVSGVTQVGIRGLNSEKKDWEDARSRGVHVVTTRDFRQYGTRHVLDTIPSGSPLFLSIDIDVFDPSLAPGTGTPEPGGIHYEEAKELIRAVAVRSSVIGMDLVEVSPPYDHGEITAVLGARLVLDAMGAVWDSHDNDRR